jgi:hypothetical protein
MWFLIVLSDNNRHPTQNFYVPDPKVIESTTLHFRPRRHQEHAFVVAVGRAEVLYDWLSGQMLKRGGSLNEASIEKDPGRGGVGDSPVVDRHLYRTPGKSDSIHPGQRCAAAPQFLVNDSPTWFLDRDKAALPKLCVDSRRRNSLKS